MKKVYQVAYRFVINGNPSAWFFSDSIFVLKADAEHFIVKLETRHDDIEVLSEIVERVLIE